MCNWAAVSPVREKPSHSGQLDEPLFHSDTHVSFPKANGTHHETFHSSPGAANSLPDVKKCTVLKGGTAVTAIQVPWLSFQPHSKPRETPEKGSRKNPFSLTQQFHLSRVFSFCYLALSHMLLWCMAGQVCLPLSSDEERQVPSVKTDILTGLAKSQG